MKKRNELDDVFNPKSIAVVGASPNPNTAGHHFFRDLVDLKFDGKIYPINLRGSDVLGFKGYRNLREAPDHIDYVTIAIPAPEVPEIIRECAAKGVKTVHIFTAGFSETGRADRIELEAQTAEIARKGNIRIIGPNCMGLYYPKIGLSNWGLFTSRESGPVGFISQSGGLALDFASMGLVRGLRFSKVVSYGNASDLDSTDFIEYFAWDDETKVVCAYIEGVKDGRRFFKVLNDTARLKPVVILKGGLSATGARTVSSHTGALAGSPTLWKALFQQSRAIQVESLREMRDLALAFSYLPCPNGRKVGIVGMSGGISVAAADSCERAGLVVPPLAEDITSSLEKIGPIAGTSMKNPVDSFLGIGVTKREYEATLRLVASDLQIDFLIIHFNIDWYFQTPEDRQNLRDFTETSIKVKESLGKPIIAILLSSQSLQSWQVFLEEQNRYLEGGIPVYSNLEDATNAVSKLIHYYELSARQ